jgi:heat shock protein HtpX
MCIALLLLGAQYVVLIGILVAAGIGVVAVAVIAAVALLVQYFSCEPIALAAMRAREVDAGQAPDLHAVAQRLCVTANLPMPRLAIVDSVMPDAFTVGRTPSTATVCATSGLLALLDDDELEAVLAHELTHIITRDVMVMTIGSCFAAIAAVIARIPPPVARRRRGRDNDNDDDDDAPAWFLAAILSGLVFMLSYVLIQALSRHREFAADRGGAALTGHPEALRSALQRISDHAAQIPQRDLRDIPGEILPLGIVAPDIEATVATLFSTHPPLQARLDALAQLEPLLPAGA